MEIDSSRQQIAKAAAQWFVHMRDDPTWELQQEFKAWILESPVHVNEYLAITQIWGDVADIDPDGIIDVESLAPVGDSAPDVIQLVDATNSATDTEFAPQPPKRSWIQHRIAAAVALMMMVPGSFLLFSELWTVERHTTGIGEQRSIVLEDGSIVQLNTQSEIIVDLDSDLRRVQLVSGEALFTVEENFSKPFVVDTGDALVRVTGTQFNIYKRATGTDVTVLDGDVRVSRLGRRNSVDPGLDPEGQADGVTAVATQHAVELKVGQQAQILSRTERIDTRAIQDVDRIIAWTERRLVFDAEPLRSIVAEFNRYNTQKLEVEDETLARLSLSGVFNSNDPDSLLAFLEKDFDIHVGRTARNVRTIRRFDASAP